MVVVLAEIGAGFGVAGLVFVLLRARRRQHLDLRQVRLRENARARRFVRHRSCGWRNASRA